MSRETSLTRRGRDCEQNSWVPLVGRWALARVDGRVLDEVQRLDLFGERLAFVEGFEEPEHGWRGDAGHQLAEQGGYPDGLAPDGEMSWR